MDVFEKKYGFEEDEKVKAFHRSRRMFCIYENRLMIAKPNLPYSHAAWFLKEGWISKENDKLMDTIVRGIVDSKGDIFFYVGYDFGVNKESENIFFKHLKELSQKLKLNPDTRIFGGLIKQEAGKIWPPKKDYGKIRERL